MKLPRELGLPSDKLGLQVRCAYGTRDARAIWEDTYREVLERAGFKCGIASPCIFWHAERQLTCVVHGDDFTTLGNDDNLNWFEDMMAKSFEIKFRGRLGKGCEGTSCLVTEGRQLVD